MNPMNPMAVTPAWLRWWGFSSALLPLFLILLFPHDILGGNLKPKGVLIAVWVLIFPVLLGVVISLTRFFRLLALPGLWLLFLAAVVRYDETPPKWSVLFLLAAFSMCLSPLIDWEISRQHKSRLKKESERPRVQ